MSFVTPAHQREGRVRFIMMFDGTSARTYAGRSLVYLSLNGTSGLAYPGRTRKAQSARERRQYTMSMFHILSHVVIEILHAEVDLEVGEASIADIRTIQE